jgi:cystathionine beta-lyase/cystathionine gamma-synthase
MELSHIINELGEDREKYFNAVAPPIIQTSNFAFKSVKQFREGLRDEYNAWIYSRANNPTVDILRKKLAALDGAEDALVFGSGIAAIATPALSLLSQGDHVISVAKPYSWTIRLFEKVLPRFGIATTFVDGTQVENFEAAIRPNTRLIYLESPNTFSYELQDLAAVAALAKSHNILTMIDNSYCSPLYQQPIQLGIDLSAQSATKYISGHSDVVAGVVTGSKKLIHHIFENEFMNIGDTISPMNAWLLLRGLRTLELRLQRSIEAAQKIIAYLSTHPKVEKIIYPYHPSFAQFELAKKQMKAGGGLFSIILKSTSLQDIETFCNSLQHFLMAVSWGGHESLVFPGAAGFPATDFDPQNLSHKLIRIYVGLEDPDYLMKDLEQALEKVM